MPQLVSNFKHIWRIGKLVHFKFTTGALGFQNHVWLLITGDQSLSFVSPFYNFCHFSGVGPVCS